jgi:hypothetical protein
MDTELHTKIKSMCHTTRDGQGHWILTGSKTVWIAELAQVVTTKRAAYAAFKAEIPEGMDVRSACGVWGCIAPDHAELCEARRRARGLSLPNQLTELSTPRYFRKPQQKSVLPDGVTLQQIEAVRFLTKTGTSMGHIRAATSLPTEEIVKIRGGVYDQAAAIAARAKESRSGYVGAKKAKSLADISGDVLIGARTAAVGASRELLGSDVPDLTEEERAWLRQVGRG